ncbi:MAG TPA: DUF2069 domain-containing protein [Luteimonas sp.]|jgi:uncharacterized membrane protein|nr:DUF2069 domain-containing protein [Luteimonas sp.]
MTPARRLLRVALLGLVLLYGAWFGGASQWAALAVFALPPLLLALMLPRHGARAGFCAGVLALLWFSHGVMVAWTRPPDRWPALAEVALALVVVFAASIPGLRARFAKKR